MITGASNPNPNQRPTLMRPEVDLVRKLRDQVIEKHEIYVAEARETTIKQPLFCKFA